ncbi:MAG: GNAT family N-acetyltransferase [Actinomycetota bacterium]|nr:GNAT family N-acetyltransferase [Actinomycetota bacterium]
MIRCVLRLATKGDRHSVLALGVCEEEDWFGQAESSAEEVGEWVDEEGGITAGVVYVEAGRVRGFAAPGRHGSCVLIADPVCPASAINILVPWLREHGPVQVITFGADRERVAALERHGLRHIRSSFSLARPADSPSLPGADWPDGIDLARYALGEDDEAVHALIYVHAAWVSVPGHTDRDLDAWREAMRPGLRAFLARRDGSPVGWIASRVLDSGVGYVSGLAVALSERRRGLGRALLLHGLADLVAAGANSLALDAQAANDTALGLYRSVGLEVKREWRVYADPPHA